MQTPLQTRLAEAQTFIPHASQFQKTSTAAGEGSFQRLFLSALYGNKNEKSPAMPDNAEKSSGTSETQDYLTQKFLEQLSAHPGQSLSAQGEKEPSSNLSRSLEEIVFSKGTEHHELISAISNSSSLDERLRLGREFRTKVGEALEASGNEVSMHADADKIIVNGQLVDILASLYSPGRSTAVQILNLGIHAQTATAATGANVPVRDPGASASMEARIKAVLDAVKNSSAGKAALAATSAASGLPSRRPHAHEFSKMVIAGINALEGLTARDGNNKDKIYVQDQNGEERYYDLIYNADGPGKASANLMKISSA